MTHRDFYFRALASVGGNSAFGNDYQGSYYSISEWASKINDAVMALIEQAENDGWVFDEEPEQPP